MMDAEYLSEHLQRAAKRMGVQKFDVCGVVREESSAGAKEGSPYSMSATSRSAVTLRVWDEKKTGVAATSNLTEEGLSTAFQLAQSCSEFSNDDVLYDLSEHSLVPLKTPAVLENNDTVSIQTLAQAALDAEEFILKNPEFKTIPYNSIGQSFTERFYFNSLGAKRISKQNAAHCYFYPLSSVEGQLPRQMGFTSVAPHFMQLNVRDCAQKAVDKTKKHLNYRKVESGKYMTVFSPDAFLELLYAFGNFFNAQNVLDKKSLCTSQSLGTQLSSAYLNVFDDPEHEANVKKVYFDGEGSPTSRLPILENGELKHFLHSHHTAQVMGHKPTGHAHLGSKITLSPHFLHVQKSVRQTQSQDLRTQSMPVIYIEDLKSLHAGINAQQGSFSLPFDGFFVNKGEATSIESATVAGDFMSLLKNICYVNDKVTHTPSGVCPEVWVHELSITGC